MKSSNVKIGCDTATSPVTPTVVPETIPTLPDTVTSPVTPVVVPATIPTLPDTVTSPVTPTVVPATVRRYLTLQHHQ